ncbi:MAG: metal-sensitive transcriptional regulator [Firmicutes bacterium]|nr:metal-sensitive transcriptional regulator [Bacillota bacterium]
MVGRVATCDDILVQLAATQGALAKIIKIVEACRVAETLAEDNSALASDPKKVQTLIQELTR